MTASFRPDCTIVSLAWASLLRKDSSCAELLQPGLGLFRSPIFLLTEKQPRLNGKLTMARTCFVLHSRGTPGVTLIPFQQSCPPEPLGVQCSGYLTPAIHLALLHPSPPAMIGRIVPP